VREAIKTREKGLSLFDSIVIMVDIIIGLWWGSIYVYIFNVNRAGSLTSEPNLTIANIEFYLAILGVCWFLWQLPYFIIKVRSGKWGC